MKIHQHITILSILLTIVHKCTSLRCYTCSAQVEPRDSYSECENFSWVFDEIHKISHCDYMDAVCAKHIVSYRGGTKWVHRGCHSNDVCNNLQLTHSGTTDQLLECSVCHDRDLCNSSHILLSNPKMFHFVFTVITLRRLLFQ